MAVQFPGKKKKLELAIKEMMKAYLEYIDQFLSGNILLDTNDFYRYETRHKRDYQNPKYWKEGDEIDLWARENFFLLCRYVVKLNDFVQAVRDYSNPKFYVIRGKFLIMDTFGTHLGEWGMMWDPKIEVIEEHLKSLEKEKAAFKKNLP